MSVVSYSVDRCWIITFGKKNKAVMNVCIVAYFNISFIGNLVVSGSKIACIHEKGSIIRPKSLGAGNLLCTSEYGIFS